LLKNNKYLKPVLSIFLKIDNTGFGDKTNYLINPCSRASFAYEAAAVSNAARGASAPVRTSGNTLPISPVAKLR
jgi:hypothetical protein